MKIFHYLLSLFIFFLIPISCAKEDKEVQQVTSDNGSYELYLVSYYDGKLILDDNRTLESNKNVIGIADTNLDYHAYVERVRQTLRVRNVLKEDVSRYELDYAKDLDILTSVKPGDKFYISLNDKVVETVASYYYVELDFEIGGGLVFYPVLMLKDEASIKEGVYVASTSNSISPTNANLSQNNFPDIVSSLLKIFEGKKVADYLNEGELPVTEFDEDEIYIIKKPEAETYIVSVAKRKSFDMYYSVAFEMTSKGEVINEIIPLNDGEFLYQQIIGAFIPQKGSEPEYLMREGYYEGENFAIMLGKNKNYRILLSGFFFGV